MTSLEHPLSYNDYKIPELKLLHHPASSPVPTPVIQVLLNRPEKNNAFTDTMVASLTTVFNLLSTDPRVKAIVLSSTDPRNKFFCPGMDLDNASQSTPKVDENSNVSAPSPAELARQREAHRDGGAQVSLAIYGCNKPVIAAINGHAVGVGITMTLPCNIRIASKDARVGFVFARRGINMEACSSFFLPRILGAGRALHLITTGATYNPGDHAVRDLFAEVVEPDLVIPRALELATEIATYTSSISTRVMKDMLYRGATTPEEAFLLESRVFFDLFRGSDAREGIVSFLEKRAPDFTARWEKEHPTVWPWWDAKKDAGQSGGLLGWLRSKL
ncbi:enoyl-CoA hydratase/isomerase [Xylariales sp. PMI_506]|nr:enoyl-CoA hydratase/isomerase [Xylariales sp. PMI_506]